MCVCACVRARAGYAEGPRVYSPIDEGFVKNVYSLLSQYEVQQAIVFM